MDVDQPLDALVQQNQKKAPRRSEGADRRQSGGAPRRDAVPYARPPPRSTDQQWVHDAYKGPRPQGRDGPRDFRERPPFTGISPRILVTGIHYEVTQADLKSIFQQAGTLVEGPTIVYDRSGRSTGEARMEFATPQAAKNAINKFDGAMTKGQTISIRMDYPARPPPPQQTNSFGDKAKSGSLLSRISGAPSAAGGPPQDRGPRPPRDARDNRDRAPRDNARPARGRGPARGGRAGPKPERKGPATQEDLDKELEGFMGRDSAPKAAAPTAAPAAATGDVEMA